MRRKRVRPVRRAVSRADRDNKEIKVSMETKSDELIDSQDPEATIDVINIDGVDVPASPDAVASHLGLSYRHQLFCDAYISSRDIIASYLEVYPENLPESARASGYRLLMRSDVKKYIEVITHAFSPKGRLTMDEILVEVERMALSKNLDSAQKLKALVLLGQRYGELTDKYEVTTKEFVIDIVDDEDDEA